MITLYFVTSDFLHSKTRHFKTLKGARRFAWRSVGETPDISLLCGYAVSRDGSARVEVEEGCSLVELFPKLGGMKLLRLRRVRNDK